MTIAILLSALVSVVTSAATALVTYRLQHRADRERWQREMVAKYAELVATDRVQAQALARQLAVGVFIVHTKGKRTKYFIPPRARFIIGTAKDCDIPVDNPFLSLHHCAVASDGDHVYVEDLGATNGVRLNGTRVGGRKQVMTGDVLDAAPGFEIEFQALEQNQP